MRTWTNIQKILFAGSLLVLLIFLAAVFLLVFTSRKRISQFQMAEKLYSLDTRESLTAAAEIYKSLLASDRNLEKAYIRLAEISKRQENYPACVFYWSRAQALNPLNSEYQSEYIGALKKTRQFQRLETYLNTLPRRTSEQELLKQYAAGQNGSSTRPAVKKNAAAPSGPEAGLLLLLHSTGRSPESKTAAAEQNLLRLSRSDSSFLRQESLIQLANLFIRRNRPAEAEKFLQTAAQENFFAAGPELAKFLATFRSFGSAIPVYEKYLTRYHDPLCAMQLAEIHALLQNRQALRSLLQQYQTNPGKTDLYCCFYISALLAFLDNNMTDVQQQLEPLEGVIRFPMVHYLRLCAALEQQNDETVLKNFTSFASARRYLDLPDRASGLVLKYITRKLEAKKSSPALWLLAEKLHQYRPSAETTCLVLLIQWEKGTLAEDTILNAVSKYPHNAGLLRLAIIHSLRNQPRKAGDLIAKFKELFPRQLQTLTDLELQHLLLTGQTDRAAEQFRKNLTPARFQMYWEFASAQKRRQDLAILMHTRGAELYQPFCRACLLMLDGRKSEALDLLAAASVRQNQQLLFYAASTLAKEGRHQQALRRYAEFPPDSPYKILILANTAEIHMACGNSDQALQLAEKAWQSNKDQPELQFCYADKLARKQLTAKIPEVIQLPRRGRDFAPGLQKLWIAGIRAQMKEDLEQKKWQTLKQKIRLLRIYAPDDPAIKEFQARIPGKEPRP